MKIISVLNFCPPLFSLRNIYTPRYTRRLKLDVNDALIAFDNK